MAAESELDRLDPEPVTVKLESGFPVEVVRLKTRQMFRLLRILTRGAGPAIANLDFTGENEAFATQLLGTVIMAIPDAEQETIAFLVSMCKPASLVDKKSAQLTKQESEANQELWDRFNDELFNPEIEDTISLLEAIIATEAPELQALGKRLQALWATARKAVGLDKPEKAPEAQDLHLPESSSPEPLPPSSTSSAMSTDGPTTTSSTSPSAASGSARRRRAAADV